MNRMDHAPRSVLVVCSRPGEARLSALAELTGSRPHRPEAAPDPTDAVAVVVDGPWPRPDAAWLAALRRAVEAGASLVLLGAAAEGWEALGAGPAGPALPAGEVFLTAAGPSPLTARLPGEFPVADAFQPLAPGPGDTVLATVSIAFSHRPAVVRRPLGRGQVVTSGVGLGPESLACAPLATVLRRALAGAAERTRTRIGVGVVGYGPFGGMGYYHGLGCQTTEGLELVAVCDANAERRKAAEEDFPGVRAYPDLESFAADPDLDVAVVATPPSLHFAQSLALLQAGKHVACEKPLCLTVSEVDRLMAAAGDAGVVLTVNQNRRWDADFRAVRRTVDAGELGEVFNVETFVGGFEHPCREWHSEVAISGGAVYDWGSHHVDWILALMGGAPSVVQTVGHKRVWHDVTNLDQLRVRMSWDDGREAEFFQSDVAAVRRPKFYVQGTAGTLVGTYRPLAFERIEPALGYRVDEPHHAEAPAELVLARYHSGYGVTRTELPPAPPEPFAFHRNLADHLIAGEPLAVPVESVRPVIAVLEASQRSSDEGGRPVELAL